MTLETLALSNVRFGWERGLSVEADHGRPKPVWRDGERSFFNRMVDGFSDGKTLDELIQPPYGIFLAALEMFAFRGLIKPGLGKIEVTNLGQMEASTHSPIQAQTDLGASQ